MQVTKTQYEELVKKIEEMKRSAGVDLATDEDLAIAVMNLISLEEHFFFTGSKTEKPEYFDLLSEIREERKALLGRLVPQHEGETWCISKHLLAATMRLMEVGTKLQALGKKEEAAEVFNRGHKLWTIFWALRLKLINTAGLKKVTDKQGGWTMQDIMNKLVDCCDE